MESETWRDRLKAEIVRQEQSMRAVSLKAGMKAGYVFSILSEGKDPGLTSLTNVCNALGVSLLRIVYGLDVTPEMEEVFQLWRQASPETRAGIVQILRGHKEPLSQRVPPTTAPGSAPLRLRKART